MNKPKSTEKRGWLLKWTNYIKGYQRRYFVLSNGELCYYKNESEIKTRCRGAIKLISAVIKNQQNFTFVINKGGTEPIHLRADNEVERQKWINALEMAKQEAIGHEDDFVNSSSTDIKIIKDELKISLDALFDKLQDIKACQEKLNTTSQELKEYLNSLTELDIDSDYDKINESGETIIVLKNFKEKNGSFEIALNSILNSCNQYNNLAQNYFSDWYTKLQNEHESKVRYEKIIDQLADQLRSLEEKVEEQNQKTYSNEDDEKFYDAEEFSNETHFNSSVVPGKAQRICLKTDLNISKQSSKLSLNSSEITNKNSKNINLNNEEFTSSDRDEDETSSNSCDEDSSKIDQFFETSVVINDELKDKNKSQNDNNNKTNFRNSESQIDLKLNSDDVDSKINKRKRRNKIPERPNQSLNLWSFMKNCIGKELTRIPMPVNFNEPISMLQRITEDFEYANLLHKAAKTSDPCEQLTYIAAFCVSHYATTSFRTSKPFNPLLGETFECDRTDDLGWKSVAEQVSHHPPMLALHCEANKWVFDSEFAISSKFRGKYLQVNPIDANHLYFPEFNYHYTWRKVTTTVHNLIVGKLWVDNHGDMIITNHTTEDKCHLKFTPYSYFSRDVPRKVTGVVLNKDNEPKWLIKGNWDKKIEVSKVLENSKAEINDGNSRIERTASKTIWKRIPSPPENEKMYNLTQLAIELNEIEEGVAPTDSRFRPDQRLMEEGNWDEANRIKGLLEQKQRDARKRKEEETAKNGSQLTEHQPIWFSKTFNEIVGDSMFKYNGEYWDKKLSQDWSKCPDIFSLNN